MFIPKGQKRKAKILLDELEKRPHELTWNSDGIIFVDQIGIPGSNMYKLFPLLFTKSKDNYTEIIGGEEFLKKIKEMGLNHILDHNPITNTDVKKKSSTIVKKSESLATDAWWYIGP